MAKRTYSAEIEANLMAVYAQANESELSEGIARYGCANATVREIATEFGITVESAAGIVAALSPGCTWEKNTHYTRVLLTALSAGQPAPLVGTYGWGNVRKAERIYRGESPLDVLGGLKVRAFYSNIIAPNRAGEITVDRHAYCAAVNRTEQRDPKWSKKNGIKFPDFASAPIYNWISAHYKQAAGKLGILPHQFQAIVWVVWRRLVNTTVTPEALESMPVAA